MTSISSVKSLELPIPPSCVAFSQTHVDIFVVGTYNLEKAKDAGHGDDGPIEPKPQDRSGSLILYKLKDGEV